MTTYHKIQTVWLRDPDNRHKTLLEGQWAKPEFEYLADCQWTMTEKVDGTNVRLIRAGEGASEVRGKTDSAQLHPGLAAACAFIVQGLGFQELPVGMVLYGEGYGAKIQSGGGYRPDQGFVLFDVWFEGLWLERSNVEDIAGQVGCDVVPIVETGTLHKMIDIVRAGDDLSRWPGVVMEGLVARPVVELQSRRGERVITKLKRKDFAR